MKGTATFIAACLCSALTQAQSEQPNRELERNYQPRALERATLRLIASNNISTSQLIEYQAGKSVVLTTGFQTRTGATFLASINTAKPEQREGGNKLVVATYPNPFAERTTITYQLTEADYTTVYVSDMDGKQVAWLLDNQVQEVGQHELVWQAGQLPSGTYVCTLETGGKRYSTRVVLK